MKSVKFEILAERRLMTGRFEIGIFRDTTTGQTQVSERAAPLVWTPMPAEGECVRVEPTLSLPPDAAQMLMDQLWHAGIRPTAGAGSAGQLTATERHLEDMRALVFKKEPKA